MDAINAFLLAIKDRGHIQPLIQHADVRLNLRWNQHRPVQLVIKNAEILILHDFENTEPPKIEISGSSEALKKLLQGKERLRIMERQGELKVRATLRTVLLLEAIFYLTKAQDDFAKIV